MDTPEEIAAEQAALAQQKEEEVRANVITEFGFDEVNDQERIDKLVAKELEHGKKLYAAVGAKIKHRTEAEALKNDPRLKVTPPPPEAAKPATEDIGKLVQEQLEKRELDALEYSDTVKARIQRVVALDGSTVKQALRDPSVVNLIAEEEKEQKAEAATISRTNRSSGKKTYSLDSPPDVNMNTPEGRKEWEEYLQAMKKAGN